MEEDEQKKRIDYKIDCFYSALSPFGGLDIREAVKIADAVGESGDFVADCIREDMDSMGITDLNQIDPVWSVLNNVFQMARNKIDEVMDIDIENDFGFYVYGNYCCSSINHNKDDLNELQEAYNKLELDDKQTLGDDDNFNYFADEVGLKTIDNGKEE